MHGTAEGPDRCLQLRQLREPVCQVGRNRNGRQLRQFESAGIRPVHPYLADQSGELRKLPAADRAGGSGRNEVIDVAEP